MSSDEPASDEPAPVVTSETRELLSRHKVEAKYLGLKQGMEPMLRVYPPRPAKMWAEFEITKYIEYEKPGKYGDEQQKKYAFVPDDETPEVQGLYAKLSEGDEVLLAWNHDYVTRSEAGGGQSKFPMRPVVMLEKR